MKLEKGLLHVVPSIIGSFVALSGVLIIIGWYTHSLFIIQPSEHFVPISFNGALCFFFAGASLFFLSRGNLIATYIFTLMLLYIGVGTLSQYIFEINLNLDELFIDAYISANPAYPGRMAPNGAIGFSLFSISLLLIPLREDKTNSFLQVNLVIHYLIISIGSFAILGYFTSLPTNYGFGQLIKMPPQSALAFILLSTGAIIYLRNEYLLNNISPLPLFVCFILFNITFLSWQMIRQNQENNLNTILQQEINNVSNYIKMAMTERADAFKRMSYRWMSQEGGTPKAVWEADVLHYIQDQPGYLAIEWVDNQYIVRWVMPKENNESVIGYNLYKDANRRAEIDLSIQKKGIQLSQQMDLLQGGEGVLFFSPLFKNNHFEGLMVGVLRTQQLFSAVIGPLSKDSLLITLRDKKELLYSNYQSYMEAEEDFTKKWRKSSRIDLYGQQWVVNVLPTPHLINKMLSPTIPFLILFVGIFISALGGFLTGALLSIRKLQSDARMANERLHGILEGSPDYIVAIDLDYNFIAFNTSYHNEIYRLFHIDIAIGMNFDQVLNCMTLDNQIKLKKLWMKALSGKAFSLTTDPFDDKHQAERYDIRFSPILDSNGELMGASHIATNINKRIENENKMAAYRQELEVLVHHLEEKNKDLQLLKEFSNILQSNVLFAQVKETISIYIKKLFPETSGIFYFYNSNDQVAELGAIWNNPIAVKDTFSPHECLGLLQNHIYYAENTKQDLVCQHVSHAVEGLTSYVCCPVLAKNEILGLMYVELNNESLNKEKEITLIQIFCEQVSLILYNIKLQESLRGLSIKDALTGLYNRRYSEELLEQQIRSVKRYSGSFGIMLLDIDYFKSINDTYGHLVGDRVLCLLAQQLDSHFRESDLVARWGGEEFILILKEISLESMVSQAEKLRQDIEHLKTKISGNEISFTISIGIAVYNNEKNKEQLIKRADDALYEAKNTGRNKVISH